MSQRVIRALILDFGGVIVVPGASADRDRWVARLGMTDQERYDALWSEANPFARAVFTGQLKPEDYWVRTGERLGLTRDESLDLGKSLYSGDRLNDDLVRLARRARENGVKLGLLSNAVGGLDWALSRLGIHDLFDSATNSHVVGLMKPDREIYLLACDRLSVSPSESLFIDDQELNVEGARRAGMQALQYLGPETVTQAARVLGLA